MALTGISRQAINSSGGAKRFYIANFADVKVAIASSVATITLADDTAIDDTNMPFKVYQVTKRSSNITSTNTGTPATGQRIEQQVATMIFHKQETAKRVEFDELGGIESVIIGEDFNGDFIVLGSRQGADLTSLVATTGTAGADLNGYTATFTADEEYAAPACDSAFVALLEKL